MLARQPAVDLVERFRHFGEFVGRDGDVGIGDSSGGACTRHAGDRTLSQMYSDPIYSFLHPQSRSANICGGAGAGSRPVSELRRVVGRSRVREATNIVPRRVVYIP